jgi:hypothetical protein
VPEEEGHHILPGVPTPEEHAWHEQEEEVHRQGDSTLCQAKCAYGTTGPCKNKKDKVCYPLNPSCNDPGVQKGQQCCPGGSVYCGTTTEGFANQVELNLPNTNHSVCYIILVLIVMLAVFWKSIF